VTAGNATVPGRKVTLDLPSGFKITNLWNGSLSGTGSTVTVTNASHNGALSPGKSTSFGFQGTGSGTGPGTGITATCARN
jgi:hypothetical protein